MSVIMNSEISKSGRELQREKRPFDKKKWREHTYSNKAKIQKWDYFKRKQATRQYHKELKKSGAFKPDGSNKSSEDQEKKTGLSALSQAKMNYQRIQKEKEERRKEIERIKKEKMEAIKEYKKQKAIKFQKLNKKTRKGQPVMKGRIELLLEKIEKEYANRSTC